MRSSSRAETARLGVLVAFAMLLSYIEILLPLNIPALPGFKLGLANTVSAAAAVYMGLYAAFAVTFVRVLLTALLFGNVQSLIFSLSGALFSLAALCFSVLFRRGRVSFAGICMLCAAMHNTGQIVAAALVFSDSAPFRFLPALLIVSLFYGMCTGIVLNLSDRALSKLLKPRSTKNARTSIVSGKEFDGARGGARTDTGPEAPGTEHAFSEEPELEKTKKQGEDAGR